MFSLKLSVSLCTLREETDDSVVEEASVKDHAWSMEPDSSDVWAQKSLIARAHARALFSCDFRP